MYKASNDTTKTPFERIEAILEVAGMTYEKNQVVPMKLLRHDDYMRSINGDHVRRLAEAIKNPTTQSFMHATPMIAKKKMASSNGNHRLEAGRLVEK